MTDSATERLSSFVRDSLGQSAEKYAQSLLESPECLTYLSNRGIDIPFGDLSNPWRLGYVADPDPIHTAMRGRLAIPYLVPEGGPVAMKFRCIQPHDCKAHECPKYLTHPGSGTRLFGVSNLDKNCAVVAICEGELDAIICTDQLGIPAVAVPGANAWRPYWGFLFEGYDKVLVLGDGDDAGQKFADGVAGQVTNGEARALPKGLDVTSFVLEQGAAEVLKWLA